MTNPCYGCEHRSRACWGVCEVYKNWKAEYEAGKERAKHGAEAADFKRKMVMKTKRKLRIER